ncbi:hypothetical protein [Janthinobacterium aquaticum]|uniref:hypothetical protein n=1 Tax=Janthinobacterium sp. FT58W TaxID=2654254 RepID=UPI001264E654|nr:hypothetical protein [Janthinobacterium sp. FT58W]KAB8044618.1 hypothetical protein GCM43_05330 [Janthinobacterium sp. FT58W]
MIHAIRSWTAVLVAAGLSACTVTEPVVAPKPATSATPALTPSRMPLLTDLGVAWDQVAHRADKRWICRATPSGTVVMTSLCEGRPKEDTRWPGLAVPDNWDGVVHMD